jgi:hypothetical protein
MGDAPFLPVVSQFASRSAALDDFVLPDDFWPRPRPILRSALRRRATRGRRVKRHGGVSAGWTDERGGIWTRPPGGWAAWRRESSSLHHLGGSDDEVVCDATGPPRRHGRIIANRLGRANLVGLDQPRPQRDKHSRSKTQLFSGPNAIKIVGPVVHNDNKQEG